MKFNRKELVSIFTLVIGVSYLFGIVSSSKAEILEENIINKKNPAKQLALQQKVEGYSNLYVAGIPGNKLRYYAAPSVRGRQIQSNWCWAASIQMVLNYYGVYADQRAIVQKIYGRQTNRPANGNQIINALSGWGFNIANRYSYIRAGYSNNLQNLLDDLKRERPIIVGMRNPNQNIGHAVVMTGYYFKFDQNRRRRVTHIIVRDPWPNNKSRQVWEWNDFSSRFMFAVRIGVTHR